MTTVTRKDLSTWYKACDVKHRIELSEDYVDFEKFEYEGRELALRGKSYIEPMIDAIDFGGSSSCQLFSGYTGTGKTTELRRLKRELEKRGYIVLMADAQEYHDLYHPLEIEDLLIILAGAFGEKAAKWIGKDPTERSYWTRFIDFMQQEVTVDELSFSAGPVSVKTAVKHGESMPQKIQQYLKTSLPSLVADIRSYLLEIITEIRQKNQNAADKEIVFIFDSLERISAPEPQFRATMDSILQVLSRHAEHLHLPECHVIYSVPPYLQVLANNLDDKYDSPLSIMPTVKVFERIEDSEDVRPYAPGIQALVQVLQKRVPVSKLFGENQAALEALVLNSGGHLKTLLRYVRDLMLRLASLEREGKLALPVPTELVDQIIQREREKIRMQIRPDGIHLLDSIRVHASLDHIRNDELELLARYQDTQLVLCYRNGDGWFEIHPLVRDLVRERAAQDKDPLAFEKGL